jgi:hypothetical protein
MPPIGNPNSGAPPSGGSNSGGSGSGGGGGGGGGGGTPGFNVPASALVGGKPGSEWKRFLRYLRNLGGQNMVRWATPIWKWGRRYQVPVAILAALIYFESRGDPDAVSKDGAVGLGQLWNKAGQQTSDGFVLRDPKNPEDNIRFTAWFFRQGYSKHGTWWKAYTEHYNPNDSNKVKFREYLNRANRFMRGGSAAPPSGLTPDEAAEAQAQQAVNQDPWVVIDPKTRKVKYVNSLEPPKGAVKMFGIPMSRSQFLQTWHSHYDPIFLAYIGRRAKPGEIAHLLARGLSDYQLINGLSRRPAFFKSETWKSRAGQYEAIGTDIITKDYKVDRELVRRAIIHNWSGETFAQKLRELPEYQFGNEFQTKATEFMSGIGMVTGGIATLRPTDNTKPKNTEGLNLHDPVLQP